MIFGKYRNTFIILILFLITELFINPTGDFCLNDDWAYAASVKTFLEKGVFELGSWPAMTLVSHTLWGVFFSKLFGFSFTVLRFSVLCLSFITVCCSERLIYKITHNSFMSLLFGLLLFWNPLFLSLSNSYMTDVSFLCFFLLSIFSFYCFFTTSHYKYLFIGFAFATVCIFIRQLGIIIPIGFLMIALLKYIANKNWKTISLLSLVLTLIIILLLFLFEKNLSNSLKEGDCFQGLFYSQKPIDISVIKFAEHFYVRLGLMFMYSGLFLFPVLIGEIPNIFNRLKSSNTISKIIVFILVILSVFVFHYFPAGNYIYNCGIGLETTMDLIELKQNLQHSNFDVLFVLLKALAIIGHCLLVCLLFSFGKPFTYLKELLQVQPFFLFIIVLLLLYQFIISLSDSFFDRYSLTFFILIVILLLYRLGTSNSLSFLTIITLCCCTCFSIFAITDYFSFNKAKTHLISELRTIKNIPSKDINGGFEYMMWNSYSTSKSRQWIDPYKEYIISFSDIKGYSKIEQYAYRRYIPHKIDTIFVLKKNAQ